MNSVIVLFVLSLITSMKCLPKLCSNDSKVLSEFTTITQLVNDSYLITDHKNHFSVVNDATFPKFTQDFNKIIDRSNKPMKDNEFFIDMSFVIDIDSNCVNIQEILFVIKFIKGENNKYTYYTNKVWQVPQRMVTLNTGHEALNKIDNVFRERYFKVFLYFQSFGLLAISDRVSDSVLVYCSLQGWKTQKNALIWDKNQIDFTNINTGFVDNDENVIYLFESSAIGGNREHIRETFYKCSYDVYKQAPNNQTQEQKLSITINCQKKPMSSFCNPKEESTDWFKIGALIGLIAICAVIAIVLIAIVCLIPSFKATSIGSPENESKTLVSGKTSRQIKPKESLTTIQTEHLKT